MVEAAPERICFLFGTLAKIWFLSLKTRAEIRPDSVVFRQFYGSGRGKFMVLGTFFVAGVINFPFGRLMLPIPYSRKCCPAFARRIYRRWHLESILKSVLQECPITTAHCGQADIVDIVDKRIFVATDSKTPQSSRKANALLRSEFGQRKIDSSENDVNSQACFERTRSLH